MPKIKVIDSKGSVLITGAAKRIGHSIALSLANLGYPIALHYHHSSQEAKALAEEIQKNKGRCEIFKADLTNKNAVKDLIPKVLKKFPHLQFLINNASIFERSTIRNGNITDFNHQFAVNLRAPFILTSQFAKRISQGCIINVLDTNISKCRTAYSSYLLSKKSLSDLTRLAAVELAPNIRVNAVAPGLILAPKDKNLDYLDRLAKSIPLKRRGNPIDIAQAVHFLIKNTYITGQTIFVDGGEHLL